MEVTPRPLTGPPATRLVTEDPPPEARDQATLLRATQDPGLERDPRPPLTAPWPPAMAPPTQDQGSIHRPLIKERPLRSIQEPRLTLLPLLSMRDPLPPPGLLQLPIAPDTRDHQAQHSIHLRQRWTLQLRQTDTRAVRMADLRARSQL